jgi:hypothetical protein
MKKTLLGFVIGIATCSLVSFKVQEYLVKPETSEVEKTQGLLIFAYGDPVMKHKSLGVVNMPGLVKTGRPKEMIAIAVKRTYNQFPDAEGIIIKGEQFQGVEAIKFEK